MRAHDRLTNASHEAISVRSPLSEILESIIDQLGDDETWLKDRIRELRLDAIAEETRVQTAQNGATK